MPAAAVGPSVRIATACGVKHLVLTHHKPRPDDSWQAELLAEVARDYTGRLSLATDGFAVAL